MEKVMALALGRDGKVASRKSDNINCKFFGKTYLLLYMYLI
jgi:hypothetical protein